VDRIELILEQRLLHDLRNSISAARVALSVACEAPGGAEVGSVRRPLVIAQSALDAAETIVGRLENSLDPGEQPDEAGTGGSTGTGGAKRSA